LNYLNGNIHHQQPQRKDGISTGDPAAVGIEPNYDSSPRALSTLVGSDLTESDHAALGARWIDRALADRAQLCRVDSLTGAQAVGRRAGNYAGILIPYFHPGSDRVREYRLRRDQPDYEYDTAGNLKPKQKYLSPPGRSNMLYLVPGVGGSLLADQELPIIITEGEFKALALWRAAHHGTPDRPRFLPVGVAGIYSWRGTIGKTVGPDGRRIDIKGAIPDLDWITWTGRRVVIAYDADAVSKELVRIARSTLAAHLRTRGAMVGFLEWDIVKGKGIDDHLACVGPDIVLVEIARVDFAGSSWKKDLLRSKPIVSNIEGRILPVLANAIAAFRHAPELGAYSLSTNSVSGQSFSDQHPGVSYPRASGLITKTAWPPNGCKDNESWYRSMWPGKLCKRPPGIIPFTR
jgi:hypothetical protein